MKIDSMRSVLAGAGGVTALALVAAGVMGIPEASAQIKDTKHNLSSSSTVSGANKFDGTAEICVFCHTPHGSDTTASVPLWNRKLPEASTYTTYSSLGTSSLDGTVMPVGSVSIACLSCHDGTQAMNTVLNAPGSGQYNAAGITMDGGWTGGNISSGKIAGGITLIGQDLRNDHPVGIQYAGGPNGTIPTAPNEYSNFMDKDFKPAKSVLLNNKPVWWVNTTVTGLNAQGGAITLSTDGREKTDMLLYTREGTASTVTAGNQPYVECASCHDPHTAANNTFLRISNSASAVCLACHIK